MKKQVQALTLAALVLPFLLSETQAQTAYDLPHMQREKLTREVSLVRKAARNNLISWRYLESDPLNIAFHVYRGTELVKTTTSTSAYVSVISGVSDYTVIPVIDGVEQTDEACKIAQDASYVIGYRKISISQPEAGITPANETYTYNANDASVADVDGDGEMEILLKWDPSNSKDNSQDGYTGNVFIDCYKQNGKQLWRVDLGKNIRAGAHYTQFMVYDFDGDGKAEMVCKTADGTKDGVGKYVGDETKDYRTTAGRILSGPEYLSVFKGETGEILYTTNYIPARGSIGSWGLDGSGKEETYGNRCDRFLACTAYLDGIKPSVVMCRGYYGRTALTAWNWDGTTLTQRWKFDIPYTNSWAGQGNHNLRVGDVDGDGYDEIVYGSMTIDHTGKGLYNTRLGHGDALHMTVFNPTEGKLGVWACHEDGVDGSTFRDAATGTILTQVKSGDDVGRCMAADIDDRYKGVEMWSARSGGILDIDGKVINTSTAAVSMNMGIWWDTDLMRELMDGTTITKYNHGTATTLLGTSTSPSTSGCDSNNGSKANPCLIADINGDWREELLLRATDNKTLRLYSSCDTTSYKFHCFLYDPIYRHSVAYQNVGYNQPTQTGFYFGADLGKLLTSNWTSKGYLVDAGMPYDSYEWKLNNEILGTERTCLIPMEKLSTSVTSTVQLTTYYRGQKFTESIALKASGVGIQSVWEQSLKVTFKDNTLSISLPESNNLTQIQIVNSLGKIFYTANLAAGNHTIETSSWQHGVYLIHFATSLEKSTQKIIKE